MFYYYLILKVRKYIKDIEKFLFNHYSVFLGLISLKIVGKRLTYRCLKYIKLPCLEKLIIKGTPLISYKEAVIKYHFIEIKQF